MQLNSVVFANQDEGLDGVQPGYLQFWTRCKQMLQKLILRFTNLPINGRETFKFLHTKINFHAIQSLKLAHNDPFWGCFHLNNQVQMEAETTVNQEF
jgi:hypothetical protein